jgi:hypothetical protein
MTRRTVLKLTGSLGLGMVAAACGLGRSEVATETVMVPMRDGVNLHTKIWKPAGERPFPAVLERGYRSGIDAHAEAFSQAGYVYVGQTSRGNLEGNMFFPDAQDGYDCLTWISQQPWCNGDIAMYGRSFMGATQWLVAPEQHPNLKAIIPQNINTDFWERTYWDHGALTLSHTARRIYRTVVSPDMTHKVAEFGGWDKFYRHLPLITLDQALIGHKNQLWQEYLTHSAYDEYWQALSARDKHDRIKIPAYLMGGWYDFYPAAAFKSFELLRALGATDEVRIIINPSDHVNRLPGDRDFGDQAHKPELEIAVRWLDYVLKGIDTGIEDEPPVKIFVMGINQWREATEWPLARTRFTNFYFHSDGPKDGWLSPDLPGDEPPNSYVYNPDDPVPTLGGNHSGPQDHPEIIRVGPLDQRPNERRQDVLTFTTSPLDADLEVTGPVTVKLYAASSAPDTDFIARLIDVYPNGVAFNITEGIIRARFRRSIWEPPQLLTPGQVYEYTIDLQVTGNVFKTGHRVRVHVTSSNFPLWDRNPNTGHPQGMTAELQAAEQTIYHDQVYSSHIILPVVPPL